MLPACTVQRKTDKKSKERWRKVFSAAGEVQFSAVLHWVKYWSLQGVVQVPAWPVWDPVAGPSLQLVPASLYCCPRAQTYWSPTSHRRKHKMRKKTDKYLLEAWMCLICLRLLTKLTFLTCLATFPLPQETSGPQPRYAFQSLLPSSVNVQK